MIQLTNRQNQFYSFIADHIKQKGYSPSVREIGNHFQISVNAVQGHINALIKKGVIKKQQGLARTITLS